MSVFNIYLLRHGELVQTGILCGRTDIALSAVGEQQLNRATQSLPEISSCYSSPLLRCRTFAEQYCEKHQLTLQISPALQEMNFGDWDGKRYQDLWQLRQKIAVSSAEKTLTLGDFWQDPWQCQPPNGETMVNFTQRVDHFWQDLLEQLQQTGAGKNQPSNILVFSHGGVIRYILAKVLGLPLPGINHMTNLDVPYGGLIHVQISFDDNANAWPKLML